MNDRQSTEARIALSALQGTAKEHFRGLPGAGRYALGLLAPATPPSLFLPESTPQSAAALIAERLGSRRVAPIGISIPKELVAETVPEKTLTTDNGQHRGQNAYQYGPDQEAAYHQHYRESRFAMTFRKGGFDCMRHLEVMANGCLPVFPGHADIPALTMVHHPKQVFAEAMHLAMEAEGLQVQGTQLIAPQRRHHTTDLEIDADYHRLTQAMLDHVRTHLTTEAMAAHLLNTMGAPPNPRVLVIGDARKADHIGNLLFHGLRSLLGENCVDAPHLPWMYTAYPTDARRQFHGLGFSFAGRLPWVDVDRTRIETQIKAKRFDLIVFASVRRACKLLPLARRHYGREQIALIDGEDDNLQVSRRRRSKPGYRWWERDRLPAQQTAYEGVYFKRELDEAFLFQYASRAEALSITL